MAKQIRLQAKRERWAVQRQALMKGKPLHYPAATTDRYQRDLSHLIKRMIKTYQPMILANFYHDEVSEMADAIKLSLRFSEWRTIEPEYGELPPRKVAKKTQSGTVNRGNVQTRTVSGKKKSVATKIMDGDPLFGDK
ncbi:hypothetical protein [Xenorhabdus bovienii]|uniref:Uncharacterized protein n=1 Tax=Xenorhabdus bovienii str. feltiae Moldova TaxID=1398200 RepID=A0A077NQK2_XENBV|nr:hypothetical protein [Xenorhabdus bovienii]CDH00799.1 hypothetical protein XBFM1_190002 [Xenorhabdus bovienii str. feltiae Moldova]